MSVKDAKGTWVLIFPIENLTLTPAVQNEIRVDRVTFVRHSKLKRKCKTFGMPNYSQVTQGSTVSRFFDERDETYTFAIVRESGLVDAAAEQAEELISMELDILALSKLYAGKVRPLLGRSVAAGEGGHVEFLAVDTGSDRRILSYRRTPNRKLVLDDEWHQWQNEYYFANLLKCVRKKNGFDKSWRATVLRAVSLVSEGLTSRMVSFSFLHNMIALETLLLRQGDEHKKELPRRLHAFIGWNSEWTKKDYPAKILDIYSKRCLYVHDGDISKIGIDDVEFTDLLLHNIFNNILNHPAMFPNKDKLVEFSDKVAAERLLGISPERSKYLRKSFKLTHKP